LWKINSVNGKWDIIPVWLAAPFISGVLAWLITSSVYIASGTFIGMALVAVCRIVWIIKTRTNARGQH
jgi:hypothetical protein